MSSAVLPLRIQRLAACIALASYVLAGVVLVGVHHHAPQAGAACCGEDSSPASSGHSCGQHGGHRGGHCHHHVAHTAGKTCGQHRHGHCQHGHHHHHPPSYVEEEQAATDVPPPSEPTHENCSICRFLAQAVPHVVLIADEQRAELRQAIAPPITCAVAATQLRTHFSRGPPVASSAA